MEGINLISTEHGIKHYTMEICGWMLFCLVCFDSLHPNKQYFNHVGMGLPRVTSTRQRIKCFDQGHITETLPVVRLKLSTLPPQSNALATEHWASHGWTFFLHTQFQHVLLCFAFLRQFFIFLVLIQRQKISYMFKISMCILCPPMSVKQKNCFTYPDIYGLDTG